ncbi:MAG: S8 family serine peptidase [Candidatus Hodarchaeales archaeon]
MLGISETITKNVLLFAIITCLLLIPISASKETVHLDNWHARAIFLPEAHSITSGSSEIIVAVLDNGVNFSHPALIDSAWHNSDEVPSNGIDDDNNGFVDDAIGGWDFINRDPVPLPTPDGEDNDNDGEIDELLWHGTFIAGLISGNDPETGFIGAAPASKIMALRILDSDAAFNETMFPSVISAIDYAINNNADVIATSFSFSERPSQSFFDTIKRAIDLGIPFVSASGNDGGAISYPGQIEKALCIGATTRSSERADFSNYGDQLDLVAPGQDITSCKQDSGYLTDSGTSYAVPLVAGTIALMKSINASISTAEIENILNETAIDLGSPGRDNEHGYGLLNSENAVRKAAGMPLRVISTSKSAMAGFSFALACILVLTQIKPRIQRK